VQPLYIKPNAGFDINGFWLPQSGDLVTVPQGGEVLFACPGSSLSGVGSSEAVLTCVGGKQFEVLFDFCNPFVAMQPAHSQNAARCIHQSKALDNFIELRSLKAIL
jgi:hypothetical protein